MTQKGRLFSDEDMESLSLEEAKRYEIKTESEHIL
jgi:hypothetical protein